jgi:coproporphyrinogen III oxidase
MFTVDQKNRLTGYFSDLRLSIIAMIEGWDRGHKFEIKKWDRDGGGSGEMGVLHGETFEKMGVNFSEVFGKLENIDLAETLPGVGSDRSFWASGVSLVSHPKNPFIPPIHMNVRAIATENAVWFGGGIDLNSIFPDEVEAAKFKEKIRDVCGRFDEKFFDKFSQKCDEYFYIPHRKESRGVGGIFFDYLLIDGDFERTFDFVKAIGDLFNVVYSDIISKKINKTWTESDREFQLFKRGRYAEFNLLYDRGIKFGLATGGNPDAMMMSLPPLVKW